MLFFPLKGLPLNYANWRFKMFSKSEGCTKTMLILTQTSFIMLNSRKLLLTTRYIYFSLLPWGQKLITQACQRICWELLPAGTEKEKALVSDAASRLFPLPDECLHPTVSCLYLETEKKKCSAIKKYEEYSWSGRYCSILYILDETPLYTVFSNFLIRLISASQNRNEKL